MNHANNDDEEDIRNKNEIHVLTEASEYYWVLSSNKPL